MAVVLGSKLLWDVSSNLVIVPRILGPSLLQVRGSIPQFYPEMQDFILVPPQI